MSQISYIKIGYQNNVVFNVEIVTRGDKTGITSKGIGTLTEAITYMYGLIAKQPPAERFAIAQTLCDFTGSTLEPIRVDFVSEFTFVLYEHGGQLLAINARFLYNFFDSFNLIFIANKSFSWPKYANPGLRTTTSTASTTPSQLTATTRNISTRERKAIEKKAIEGKVNVRSSGIQSHNEKKECCRVNASEVDTQGGGLIRFTPEFNIDTSFDNANFYRAQNDNFTEKIFQFVNAPSFNKALFIRPKLHKVKRCKCKCEKKKKQHKSKHESLPTTTANDLQLMVAQIYQICIEIQNNQVTWEDGSAAIMSAIEENDKYLVKGARSVFYLTMTGGLLYLQLINRYNLPSSDCVVAFTVDGAIDFTSDSLNDLVLSVSEVPVDEDMSEAIYSPIVGIFAYGNIPDPEAS